MSSTITIIAASAFAGGLAVGILATSISVTTYAAFATGLACGAAALFLLLRRTNRVLLRCLREEVQRLMADCLSLIKQPSQVVQQKLKEAKDRGDGRDMIPKFRDMPGFMGVDIGGTSAKVAIGFPAAMENVHTIPDRFGPTGMAHPELTFYIAVNGERLCLRFISSSTNHLEEGVLLLQESPIYNVPKIPRKVVTAGGGAHRFKSLFLKVLGVELVPFKELQAVVEGLGFLQKFGPRNSLFCVDKNGEDREADWPGNTYPFMLVNIGSGVSILRVDSDTEFTRVGGTACGGATFLGLSKLISSASSFEDLISLAEKGDAALVDKLVGDIYGTAGCQDLGMPSAMTAAHFGKLAAHDRTDPGPNPSDLVRSVLQMVAQASAVLAKAFAQRYGCVDRVFFSGGFLYNNKLARRLIGESMESLGGRAYFSKHCEFMGALGSLGSSLNGTQCHVAHCPS